MCISRFFQFAVVALLLGLLMVACRPYPESLAHAMPVERSHPLNPELRKYVLYNRCSKKHVQIPGKKVNAGPGFFDELLVRDVGFNSTIKIQGYKSKAYLCFNKKGRLKARFHFVADNCVFEEKIDDNMYTALWLRRKNKLWKVGFNKNGHALLGDSYNKHTDPTCFQFMKRPPPGNPSTNTNFVLEKLYSDDAPTTKRPNHRKRYKRPHRIRHAGRNEVNAARR